MRSNARGDSVLLITELWKRSRKQPCLARYSNEPLVLLTGILGLLAIILCKH